MKSKKHEALWIVAKGFLEELSKLDRVDRYTTEQNFRRSLFLSNADVSRIRARKSVMQGLFDSITTQVFEASTLSKKLKYFPYDGTFGVEKLNRDVKIMQTNINTLDEEKVEDILQSFLEKTAPFMLNGPTPERSPYKDAAYQMEGDDEKRGALKEHSFSDFYQNL